MAVKRLSDTVADLAMHKVAALLADRVADRVVDPLMRAGFEKQFGDALLRRLKEKAEEDRQPRLCPGSQRTRQII